MAAKYIYRLDDIAPDMNWEQFRRYMELFRTYNVVPLLGVIPDNKDPNLSVGKAKGEFWNIIREMQSKGEIEVAQHGYRHELKKTQGSVLSEFAGLPYDRQYEMIRSGMQIMRNNGVYSDVWMAPCHTSDKVTLDALAELGFRSVTDGTGLYPFTRHRLVFVPQQLWRPRKLPWGIYTICLHINDSDEYMYQMVKRHLESDACIIRFSEAAAIKAGTAGLAMNVLFGMAYIILKGLKKAAKGGRRGRNEN